MKLWKDSSHRRRPGTAEVAAATAEWEWQRRRRGQAGRKVRKCFTNSAEEPGCDTQLAARLSLITRRVLAQHTTHRLLRLLESLSPTPSIDGTNPASTVCASRSSRRITATCSSQHDLLAPSSTGMHPRVAADIDRPHSRRLASTPSQQAVSDLDVGGHVTG